MPPEAINWVGRDNNQSYFSGESAIVFNSPSVLLWARDNDPELAENTLITEVPAGPAEKVYIGPIYGNYIWKDTKHPELAKALLEYMQQPDFLKEQVQPYSSRPEARPDVRDVPLWTEDSQMAPFATQAPYNKHVGYPGPSTLWAHENFRVNVECQMLSKVIIDGWTLEQAAEWAQGELQKIYDAYQ
jgi:multiple sugar transport system substrate-binding protein